MKELFRGYYRPSSAEFAELWKSATFVFDTNVLLSLYSLPESVREVYLAVLRKISDRIWIPYHVALEFHRNRFARIRQDNLRLEKALASIGEATDRIKVDVETMELEKRNIGVKDVSEHLRAIEAAHKALYDTVALACQKLPAISLDDPIGEQISEIIKSNVGVPPSNQEALDALLEGAQHRFDSKIPPGFADVDKGEDTFVDREIVYKRKFGDLILWRQLLLHAKENNLANIVFVTGERKKDWWLLEDGKTLGPLPGLTQEIIVKGGVKLFWMYSTVQFLQNAQNYLKASEVTSETIEQVKDIAQSVAENELQDTIGSFTAASSSEADQAIVHAQDDDLKRGDEPRTHHYMPSIAFRNTDAGRRAITQAVANWVISRTEAMVEFKPGSLELVRKGPHGVIGYKIRPTVNLWRELESKSFLNWISVCSDEVEQGRFSRLNIVVALMPRGHISKNETAEMRARLLMLVDLYEIDSVIVGNYGQRTFRSVLVLQNG